MSRASSAPDWILPPDDAWILSLLAEGALAPVEGYRLPGPHDRLAPVLRVDAATARAAAEAGRLVLRDDDGTVLAELEPSGDPVEEPDGRAAVAGTVHGRARPRPLAFPELHRTLEEVREALADGPVTAVQPTEVPDVATVARWRQHLDATGDRLLVHPLIPPMSNERWAATVRAHRAALTHLGADRSLLQLVPLPRDEHTQDAATLRALVAANLGAGTLLDAAGVDPDVAADRGLTLLPAPAGPSGPWHPEVQAELDRAPVGHGGTVVLLTGLSGSGKSTLARALRGRLLERGERSVTLLDGDLVRHTLSSGLGFSPEDRERNVRRIGWVAAEVARHGGVAICAPIAPEDRVRKAVRADVAAAGGRFVLVHVATPLEVCEQRDAKGLYARARAGTLPGFTGIDAPYEEPDDAEVAVDTTSSSVAEVVDRLVAALEDA